MEDKHKTEIIRAIGNLEGTTKTGFKATNEHLKTLNGQVVNQGKEIVNLKLVDVGMEGRLKGVEKNTSKINNRAWDIIKFVIVFIIGAGLTFLIK